jgi:hypothetical protein
VKYEAQLRIGLINEIFSEGIYITVIRAVWRFFLYFKAVMSVA